MNTFRKQEYLTLRKEVQTHVADLGQLERNCVLLCGAVYVWLLTDSNQGELAGYGWYVPTLFAIFGFLRSISLACHLRELGKYIKRIESAEHANHSDKKKSPGGWEHYFEKNGKPIRTVVTAVFWMLLISTTIVVGMCGHAASSGGPEKVL